MRSRFLCLWAFLLLFTALSPALVSCEKDGDFLSWNKGSLAFIGEYEEDGCVFRARFYLDGHNSVSVEMLSPDSVTGIIYKKSGDMITAEYGDVSLSLSSPPAAISYALLAVPEDPLLESVVKEGAVKTETVRAKGGIYKIRYSAEGLPEEIVLLSEGTQKSLYIVSFPSSEGELSEAP